MSAFAPGFLKDGLSYNPENPQIYLPDSAFDHLSPLALDPEDQAYDYWQLVGLDHRNAQPKLEPAEYIESLDIGIKVPRRFATAADTVIAIRSGKTVMARSEHPGEYDDFSDIFKTHYWDEEWLEKSTEKTAQMLRQGASEPEIQDHLRQEQFLGTIEGPSLADRYAKLNGIRPESFGSQLSYTYWEHIPGYNVVVTADDTQAGKYYVGVQSREWGFKETWIVEDGSPEHRLAGAEDPISDKRLIEAYETIRNLDCFDSNNCPLIELQVDGEGDVWFLQYMKGRTFTPSTARLHQRDYRAADGWRRADAVRGMLGSFLTLQAGLIYPEQYGLSEDLPLPEFEEASFDRYPEKALLHTLLRDRICSIYTRGKQNVYNGIADGHTVRSQWFRPQASISISERSLAAIIDRPLHGRLLAAERQDLMARVLVDVASDGKRGFIRLNQAGDPLIIEHA
jgi:hypothetical protein